MILGLMYVEMLGVRFKFQRALRRHRRRFESGTGLVAILLAKHFSAGASSVAVSGIVYYIVVRCDSDDCPLERIADFVPPERGKFDAPGDWFD